MDEMMLLESARIADERMKAQMERLRQLEQVVREWLELMDETGDELFTLDPSENEKEEQSLFVVEVPREWIKRRDALHKRAKALLEQEVK